MSAGETLIVGGPMRLSFAIVEICFVRSPLGAEQQVIIELG